MKRSGWIALGLVAAMAGAGGAEEEVLTLARARALARETSPVLRQYRARSREARYKVDEVYTQAYPTLNLSAGYTRQSPAVTLNAFGLNIPFLVEHNYAVQLSLRQSIYTFGRLKWGAANAELMEKGQKAELAYQEERVDEEAKVDFLDAQSTAEQVLIAQDNVKSRLAHLDEARKLVSTGVAAGFDVKRDEAALAQAQQALLEAENRAGVARARLLSLLGLPRQAPVQLEKLQGDLAPPAPSADAGLQQALDRRQDLQASRWAVEAARARVQLAEAEDNPNLQFQSDLVQRNQAGFTPGNLWTAGIVFNVPLYDGGLTEARSNQAREVVTQLEALLDNSKRSVQLEVDSLYLDLINRWKRIEVTKVALVSAQEAARIARLRYRNGLSTNVELLDAEAALTTAQQDVVTARYQYMETVAHWERVVPAGSEQP